MPDTLSYNLKDDLGLIPGYDSYADADGCWFDEERALFAIGFIEDCCTHIEGGMSRKPFILEPWQRAAVAMIFGWVRLDDQGRTVRRYREVLLYVPRKNGKTPFCAAMANLVLFIDDEDGQQNYCAAAEREQASLLFRQMAGMIENDSVLDSRARILRSTRTIMLEGTNSFLKAIPADAHTQHGQLPHLIMVDELHAQPNRYLVDVLQTGMASKNRKQPLMICLTTADFDRPSICNEKYDYACKVRDGVIKDKSFLPIIFEAKLTDDWRSPDVWAKANPNLGVSVSREYIERECQRAQDTPSYENTFKRLHLNIRTEQDVRWLQLEKWDACPSDYPDSELLGQSCYCGLDLSTTTDITAFAMAFPMEGKYIVRVCYWIPAERADLRERRDRVPYLQWVKEGFIRTTPGDVVDYAIVERDILEFSKQYNILEIAADPWNATQVIQRLDGEGLVIFEHRQGYASISGPTKEFEKAVIGTKLDHGGDPVLRWMASNVSVEMDAAGNIKPSKKKSTERIDGIVAAVMAIGRAALNDSGQSYYETHSLEVF